MRVGAVGHPGLWVVAGKPAGVKGAAPWGEGKAPHNETVRDPLSAQG
jgi:hypothetical protein